MYFMYTENAKSLKMTDKRSGIQNQCRKRGNRCLELKKSKEVGNKSVYTHYLL